MVQATEKQISALIHAVKELPVDCKNFEIADTWVGIVIELERIAENTVVLPEETDANDAEASPAKPVEIRYAPPENIINDNEVVEDG